MLGRVRCEIMNCYISRDVQLEYLFQWCPSSVAKCLSNITQAHITRRTVWNSMLTTFGVEPSLYHFHTITSNRSTIKFLNTKPISAQRINLFCQVKLIYLFVSCKEPEARIVFLINQSNLSKISLIFLLTNTNRSDSLKNRVTGFKLL